ncbi:WD40-repeat-containing domain protein, partial [Scleroderma citrinum]
FTIMKFQPFVLEHTLENHTSSVNTLAFAPTGNYLASGSNNGSLIIWDPMTGLMKNHIIFHNPILSLAWDLQHLKHLYIGCEDGTLALLDNFETQEPCHSVLTGIKSSVFAVSIDEYSGSVAICIGPEVHLAKEIAPVRYASSRLFPSLHKFSAKQEVDKHVHGQVLTFTERGAKLIIAYLYHGIVCWDMNISQCLWHINPIHGHQIMYVNISLWACCPFFGPQRVVLSNLSEGVDVYLVGQSHPELHLKHHPILEERNVPLQVAFIFEGSAIISGSSDGKVPVWAATSGECIQLLEH